MLTLLIILGALVLAFISPLAVGLLFAGGVLLFVVLPVVLAAIGIAVVAPVVIVAFALGAALVITIGAVIYGGVMRLITGDERYFQFQFNSKSE